MSIVLEILNEMLNTSIRYKGARVNLFGIPKFQDIKYESLKSRAYYLKGKGLLDKNESGWLLTEKGKVYLKKKENAHKIIEHSFPKNAPKDLLVMFDVPETRKTERDWLRLHLKRFEYIMIQKSVWVGPSPLPKEFTLYLKQIGIDKTLKTFKLAKGYKG